MNSHLSSFVQNLFTAECERVDLLFTTKKALVPTADTVILRDWEFPTTLNFLKKNNNVGKNSYILLELNKLLSRGTFKNSSTSIASIISAFSINLALTVFCLTLPEFY